MDFEIRPFPKKTTARVAPPKKVITNTTNAAFPDAPPPHSCYFCQDRPPPPRERLPPKSVPKSESGTQTLVHPVETKIVKSYEWNEWELRRKALQLANIRARATHSTQTPNSHMRRDNATQVWLRKDADSQSRTYGHSNVPKPHVYMAGLRGQQESCVVKVDLTRPVDD